MRFYTLKWQQVNNETDEQEQYPAKEVYRESQLVESDSGLTGEWTCEGGPKDQVGADGNSNRYDESVCLCVITIKVAAVYPVPLWSRFIFLETKGDYCYEQLQRF